MEGMSRNAARSYVYAITAWVMFVPGAIYLAVYSEWRKRHPWSAICLIWEWALVVEIIRCALIWIILLRSDWDAQVVLAKERSEANKQLSENDIVTSPKTRVLIQNKDKEEAKGIKCTLHRISNKDVKEATDNYLCLN
eukprot:230592_1